MEAKKAFEITPRKTATLNEYQGKSYIHFHDRAKEKTFSFNSSEFKMLMKKKDDIEKFFIYLSRRREKEAEDKEDDDDDEEEKTKKKMKKKKTSKRKGGGEKRYSDPTDYYASDESPKQKCLRPEFPEGLDDY